MQQCANTPIGSQLNEAHISSKIKITKLDTRKRKEDKHKTTGA